MKEHFSASELCEMLGTTVRAVQLRACEENWAYIAEVSRGGRRKLYAFESLPQSCKAKISEALALENPTESVADIDEKGAQIWAKLSERDRQLALARNAVRIAANSYRRNTGRVQALAEFYRLLGPAMRERDMNAFDRLGFSFDAAAAVLTHVQKVSLQTHYRWDKQYDEAEQNLGLGLLGLVRIKRESFGLGAKSLSAEMIAHARSLILTGKVKLCAISREKDGRVVELNRKLLYRRLSNKFGRENLPSYAHFTRWANGYLLEHQADLCAIALPAFYRAAFGLDGGCASADVSFAGEIWEVDGTRADVMLADGRHEILVAIDLFSRDMVVEIEKSASSITVARLYYNGMTRWGVPRTIKTDNGSIFTSDHMRGALELLKIEQDLSKPYTPDDKPHIERAIGTLTKMLFEGMTWYIGHDPKERRRIDEYGKFSQVFYYRSGEKISCDATAEELRETIENWLGKVYRQEEHRFADVRLGRSRFILDRLANSPGRAGAIRNARALEDLLSPPFDRVLNNSQVTWMDIPYRPAAQEDWERSLKYGKQKVIFRPNLSDIRTGTLWQAIPDGDGKYRSGDFICRVTANVSEQSVEEFREARKNDRKRHKARKKAVDVLFAPSYERELAEMPLPKVACANFGAVEYDGEAYQDLTRYKSSKMQDLPGRNGRLTDEAKSLLRAELLEKELAMENVRPNTPDDVCNGNGRVSTWEEISALEPVDQYVRLMEMEVSGILIPGNYKSAMRYFEASPEYLQRRDYYERMRASFAVRRI